MESFELQQYYISIRAIGKHMVARYYSLQQVTYNETLNLPKYVKIAT